MVTTPKRANWRIRVAKNRITGFWDMTCSCPVVSSWAEPSERTYAQCLTWDIAW